MSESIENKKFILKSFSIVAISNIIIKPFWFFLFIIAARFLGTSGFGLFMYFNSIAMMAMIFIDFGLDYITVREVSKKNDQMELYFKNTVFMRTVFYLVISFVFLPYFVFFTNYSNSEIFTFFFILGYLFLANILNYFRTSISTQYEFKLISKILLLEKLLIVVFGFLALILIKTVFSFSLSLFSANVLTLAFYLFLFRNKFHNNGNSVSFNSLKKLIILALPLLIMNVFNTIYFRADLILLEFLTNNKKVLGIYGSNHRILELFLFVPTILMSVASPIISKNIVDKKDFTISFVNKNLQYLLALSLFVAIVVSFNSYGINMLLFGKEYEQGYFSFSIIIWTILPLGLNFVLGNILFILNREKYLILTLFFASILNVSLNALLIPAFSYVGTSISALTSEILIFFMYLFFVVKYFGKINILDNLLKCLFIIALVICVYSVLILFVNYSFILFTIIISIVTMGLILGLKLVNIGELLTRKVIQK